MAIADLTPYPGHPFKLYEGERLDDMIESIRSNGVLVPIIVRKIADPLEPHDRLDPIGSLEILAGHNRVNAAKLAGLDTIPALVMENVSDEDALVYVVETNLIQRSFADMTHSEKAAVIALHHSKMFSQGKRNDILEQIKMLEYPHGYRENSTSAQVGRKLESREKVAQEYSLSRNTVSRYIRVQYLIPALKNLLDSGKLAFIPAVTLSFLNEAEQELVVACMELNKFNVDMKKADALRQYSEKGKLDEDSVYLILSGEAIPKKSNKTPTVKVSKAVYAKYFTIEQSAKEVQTIVEKALDMFFSSQGNDI